MHHQRLHRLKVHQHSSQQTGQQEALPSCATANQSVLAVEVLAVALQTNIQCGGKQR